ncbi:dihydrouridine synthase [Candidatus Woesebacteria bacterium]|nr:dihydrouridine synthase [Candidatus Woesebacteria bacterium]|tara:strand:- start:431 stop:1378 length:948 start_codon:yes stop_codon:yes gene_type:complete
MKNFWEKLNKPIFCLAPMADVTDAAFRKIIVKYSKPDIVFTEFVSCDGLNSPGKDNLMVDLEFSKKERPIVAQFFGSRPENFTKCAKLAVKLGFDGIDINMGCPIKKIEKQGAGCDLIRHPRLAQEIIAATKAGAGNLPVSVKTRVGYNSDELDTWLPTLLEAKPAAITIHARTKKQMSKVPAEWHLIKKAVKIAKGSGVLILGNGDVKDLDDAAQKVKQTGCDGVMLGRAIFGNPWLFDKDKKEVTRDEKLKVMVEHTKLFEKLFKNKKNFAIMRKHYKAYVDGFPGAKALRMKLMETKNAREVEEIVAGFLSQ